MFSKIILFISFSIPQWIKDDLRYPIACRRLPLLEEQLAQQVTVGKLIYAEQRTMLKGMAAQVILPNDERLVEVENRLCENAGSISVLRMEVDECRSIISRVDERYARRQAHYAS